MAGTAFSSGVFQSSFLPALSPGRLCPHLRSEHHAARPRVSAALQEVDPTKLPPSTAPLPTGTVFHLLRGHPAHLPPPSHNIDGDGYLLAATLSPDGPFLRGRYVRTRAYLRESRARERLYPSRGGTPSSRRYRRLRKACADGVFAWGGRLLAWGESGLPMGIDACTLVSRAYSALGTALTDRDEMVRERGQAVAARPVEMDDGTLAVCATSEGGALFFVRVDGEFGVVERPELVQLGKDSLVLDFAVTDRYFVAMCARTVPMSTGASFRSLLSGFTQAPDVDAAAGSFLAFVPREEGAEAVLVNLPDGAFCTRIDSASNDGESVALRLCEMPGVAKTLSRAGLADLSSTAAQTASRFRVEVSAQEATRLQSEPQSAVVSGLSPCGRYASVYDTGSQRIGISRVSDGVDSSELDAFWLPEGTAGVSGVAASPDGTATSALVHSETGATLQFWDADDIAAGTIHSIDLPVAQFGEVPRSAGACWESLAPDWPEGGKVVKSAYEIFDDRDWNEINSGFSSIGLNQ